MAKVLFIVGSAVLGLVIVFIGQWFTEKLDDH